MHIHITGWAQVFFLGCLLLFLFYLQNEDFDLFNFYDYKINDLACLDLYKNIYFYVWSEKYSLFDYFFIWLWINFEFKKKKKNGLSHFSPFTWKFCHFNPILPSPWKLSFCLEHKHVFSKLRKCIRIPKKCLDLGI